MLQNAYRRLDTLAASPRAVIWLAVVAIAEASFFPVPVDVLLIPILLARRDRVWRLAAICTVASVLGGLVGWGLGAVLMAHIGMPIARFYHAEGRVIALESLFDRYGIWIILAKGLTPLPYKFVTLAAGASHFPLLPFFAASVVTRGGRFFLEAALIRLFGEPVRAFIERRLTLVLLGALVVIVGGVLLVEVL